MSTGLKRAFREEPTAALFLISSVVFFAITTLVGLLVATKFVLPEFMGNIPQLTIGRLRPLHVNGVLFGWLLAADMGLCFYLVPRLCGTKLWSEKLGVATAVIALGFVIGTAAIAVLVHGAEKRAPAPPAAQPAE